MSFGRQVINRIDVLNDPVNWVDPWGLWVANTAEENRRQSVERNKLLRERQAQEMKAIKDALFPSLEERRDLYEPYIKRNAEELGKAYDLNRILPTNGELFFWGIGPFPGIYDLLPKNKDCK